MDSVLLIEDDPGIGGELEQALAGHGLAVSWVRNGADATEAATAAPPDLVLLDLGLPDVDGVAWCRKMRGTLPAETVIVVLTARTQEFEVVVALDAGADDYLTK